MKQLTYSIIAGTLLLSPAAAVTDLGEIIVTSTDRLPQKVKNSTATIAVITAEEIAERGYQSVTEVLSHQAGLSFASNGGAGQTSSLFIRGLKSDNLLILLDGVPLTDYTQPSAAASLEHISLSSVERVELVKGGQSGIWGAGAAAGTVNIITRGGERDEGSITLQAGSHGTKAIGFNLAKVSDWGSIYLGGTLFDTDSISAVLPADAEKDGYRNNDGHLKASFHLDDASTVSFFYHSYRGRYDFDDPANANDTSSKGKSDQDIFGFSYSYRKDALSVDAKVSHRDITRHLEGSGAWGPWIYDTDGASTDYSVVAAYRFDAAQSLSIGAIHTLNRATTDNGFDPSSATFKNNALFANYSYTLNALLGAKTTLNAALRYDHFDTFDNKGTYRFGIKRVCNAIEGLHTAANIYTGYKAPSLYQFSHAAGILKPESLEGYELSIGYKKLLNLTYFSNKIKDKIDSSYDPATFTTNYFNHGNGVKITGLELSTEYALGESGFIVGAHLTHMIDYQDEGGKDLQRIPQNSVSAYLDYYFGQDSHIAVTANYAGKRRDMDYSSWPASDVTLKSYTTVDLTYNTTLNEHFKLSVTAKNIFDKTYETVKGYSTEGRSIYATIEYRF